MITLGQIGDVPIKNIKVKLPDLYFNSANQFDEEGEQTIPQEVWLVGPMMGDWFVKKEREDSQIFPLFFDYISWDELKNWEIVEIFKD